MRQLVCVAVIGASLAMLGGAVEMKNPQFMAGTPVSAEVLDNATFAVWLEGAETPVTNANPKVNLETIVWSTSAQHISWAGLAFGWSKNPGPRHLRCGFTAPVAAETVLVSGGGVLSVLKPGAPYPGRLDNEGDWLPAQRLDLQGNVTGGPVAEKEFGVWTLPPGTRTRALRFTHTAHPSDSNPQGWIGGVLVLPERFINVAPYAQVITAANQQNASRLNDMRRWGWGAWSNLPVSTNAARAVLSEGAPEPIVLVWPEAVTLDALVGITTAFSAVGIDAYAGPPGTHPRSATERDWRPVKSFSGIRLGYPVTLWPNYFVFDEPVTARAFRLRVTGAIPEDHDHLRPKTNGGRRFWLDEIVALMRPEESREVEKYRSTEVEKSKSREVEKLRSTEVEKSKSTEVEKSKSREVGNSKLLNSSTSQLLNSSISKLLPPPPPPSPPIPVPFSIPEAGYVTLVIEDKDGNRVRNLVSETKFPAGKNTVWWDGTDDLGRDIDAAKHGLYSIPPAPVAPGKYTARGLWHKGTKLSYEFSVYSTGTPPWDTPDHTGAWLANHSPPSGAAFVPAERSPIGEPAVFLGSFVTEGPDGFIWVDMKGNKRGGMKWIGGNWTAAPYIAADVGPQADTNVSVYIASAFRPDNGTKGIELRITEMSKGQRIREILKTPIVEDTVAEHDLMRVMHGIAVYDKKIAVALTHSNAIWIVDAATGKVERDIPVGPPPTGIAYAPDGKLYALTGGALAHVEGERPRGPLVKGFEAPASLTIDAKGNFYVSDHGTSHQVKVFSSEGAPLGTIGEAGPPKAGPYDELHMNNPWQTAVDHEGRVWVAECDYLPKRVSIWGSSKVLKFESSKVPSGTAPDSADAHNFRTLELSNFRTLELLFAFYGPGKYGGGGQLDNTDPKRFYYADEGHGTLEFELDWKTGKDKLVNVLYRNDATSFTFPRRIAAPETAHRVNGRRYFSNAHNSNPVGGSGAFVFEDRGGVAVPVAGMGMANDWPLLHGDEFKHLVPEGSDPKRGLWDDNRKHAVFFIWNDLNGDGAVQPDEVQMSREVTTGITVLDDLSFAVACLNGKAVRFKPEWKKGVKGSRGSGVQETTAIDGNRMPSTAIETLTPRPLNPLTPIYQRAKGIALVEGVYRPMSSGGDQMLADDSGEAVLTLGAEPFHSHSITGVKNGKAVWSYPNAWPGLHASHEASYPQFPGHVIGATRLLGGFINPKGSKVKPLWAVNGNMGPIYLFTRDGLFVSSLFEDVRVGKLWQMLAAPRGMPLENITLHDENFWPSIGQSRGQVYLVDGARTSLVRVDGLDTLRPIAPITVNVTPALLAQAQDYRQALERQRQQSSGTGVLRVPTVDGMAADGDFAKWDPIPAVEIDKRGTKAWFNSNAQPFDITGRMAISGDRLHACWDTQLPNLLRNSGEMPTALFKTGGALDIMLGTDPSAASGRRAPVPGDLRLIVTRVGNDIKALLYRPVLSSNKTNETNEKNKDSYSFNSVNSMTETKTETKVPFSSPWRTITFDEVRDVSEHVRLAEDKTGRYEISVPLSVLGLAPSPGMRLSGDIGILRGENNQTTARIYWTNKATAITSDVPSEAELTPALWGILEFN
ncbi:MAG: hypothetical protein FWH21_01790 [Kiritimatiellaeota bacterium]|nr:hypothetical protein [Kiritimatiellota bacterium]